MQPYYDLRIRIYKSEYEGYKVEVRSLDGEWVSNQLPEWDFSLLEKQAKNPSTYGSTLFDWLFVGEVKEAFRRAQYLSSASLGSQAAPAGTLRILLEIDPQFEFGPLASRGRRLNWATFHEQASKGLGPSLEMESRSSRSYRLRWEALYDSVQKAPLALTTAFSRYVRRPLQGADLVSERPLRMLLLAPQPADLERFGLAPFAPSDPNLVEAIAEVAERSAAELVKVERKIGTLTLEQLSREASQGSYHIVHLMAHAVSGNEDATLIFADNAGAAHPVPFATLVQALMPREQRAPSLIFLTTPPPGEQAELLANLALMLVKAGAQAVLAIASPMAASGFQLFTDRFYATLFQTGIIDVAVRDARAVIYRPDSWEWVSAVLYLGTPDAQLFQPLPESLASKLKML